MAEPRKYESGHRYGSEEWPIGTSYRAELGYGKPTQVGPEARVSWSSLSSKELDRLSKDMEL